MSAPHNRIHNYLLVRLISQVMLRIANTNFIYGELIESIRADVDHDVQKKGIIFKPVRHGVCYRVATLSIDSFFECLADRDPFFYKYFADDIVGIAEDLFDGWHPDNWGSDEEVEAAYDWLSDVKTEEDDDKIANIIVDRGWEALATYSDRCRKSEHYVETRDLYAVEVADRLLHDRAISAYIAEALLLLAPGTEPYINSRAKFAGRVKWPTFVKSILFSRDRGKCAYCRSDIGIELLAKANVDHIYPLADGGCNDIVNLQLTCETCNKSKHTARWETVSSVPQYHPRATAIRKANKH